jgi:glycosyltransferase involved in cell wall biosynthesis
MIRVLHVLQSIKDVKHFTGLAKYHDKRLVEMQVCTIDGTGYLQESVAALGVRGHSLDCGARWRYPLAIWRLARLLKRERIDVVHAHLFEPTVIGLAAALLARTPGRVMTRHHADLHFFLKKPFHSRIDRWSALLAHRVIAVSGQARDVLTAMEGVPADRVTVVLPGSFITPGTRAPDAECEAVRREFNLHGCYVLGVVARLHPIKGQEDLFKALPEIAQVAPNVRVLLIGEGWLRPHLEQMADTLRIRERVIFAGYRRDIPALYGVMDAVVHPTYEDSVATPVMEGLAYGVPVVCTPKGVALDLIRDGETGLLVPPGDPARLAAAISRLARSPELQRAFAARGPLAVGDRFTFAGNAQGYERAYQEILGMGQDTPSNTREALSS